MTDEPRREPTEDEIRAAFEEQMKRITVRDVLLQTAITLINIAARRLGLTGEEGAQDLKEAHTAIEGVRALLPLLPPEEQQAVKEPLSQLQMHYAQLAKGEAPAPGTRDPGPEKPDTRDPTPDTPNDDAERAKARSKIWTPPGT
ncbi:MAG TPA: hypothetical protein VJU79_00280 [Candidatus Dormibacteraeota bacterium]|nr:hypothetical protein [Candidatus Dormibacteraeota bacterium]